MTFWTAKEDQFVSYRHCIWMAERVPGADLHVYADEGHLSLRQHHLLEIIADLVGCAGW